MECFTNDQQQDIVVRLGGLEKERIFSFEKFCQLQTYLHGMHFTQEQTQPTRKPCISLETLYRNNAIQRLLKRGFLRGSFCSLMPDNNSALLSFIMQCTPKALEAMLEHFYMDDPMHKVVVDRLEELRKEPAAEYEAELPPDNSDDQFFQVLKDKAEEKFKSVSQLAEYAGVSKQVISKINTGKQHVSREVALRLAVALELDYEEASRFLALAGYTLRANNRREAIISFIMRHPPYTMSEMEEALMLMEEKGFRD